MSGGHPLHALELAARAYDKAARRSVLCDNAVEHATPMWVTRKRRAAAEARANKIAASQALQDAAVAFAQWKAQP